MTSKSFRTLLSNLARNRAGNIAMFFGFAALPAMMAVGGAVDFMNASRTKARLQGAADAAAMAAMATRGQSNTEREAVATNIFNQNVNAFHSTQGATASVTVSRGVATVTSTYNMPTAMLKIAGWNSIALSVTSTVSATGKKIELALMTDITGSMNETRNGQVKLDGLKLAAADMLDILLPPTPIDDEARVSLVPFANVVNAGDYAVAVTGMSATAYLSGSNQKLITCVTERTGSEAYTDAVPGPSKWLGASTQGENGSSYSPSGHCIRSTFGQGNQSPMPEVVPLTNNREFLKGKIQSFTSGGSTAGHLGTAWAWYTLAPDWNSIFNLSNPPKPYNDPDYLKVAVLMTDGEYNTQYAAADSKEQALALCTAMKEKGIKVITVGLGFDQYGGDSVARSTLTQCSSGDGHYFFPYDGDALRQVFVQIGDQVTTWAGKVRMIQ